MSRVTKCDWCGTEKVKGQVWPLWFQLSYQPPPGLEGTLLYGVMVERDACSPKCLEGLSAQVTREIEGRREKKG